MKTPKRLKPFTILILILFLANFLSSPARMDEKAESSANILKNMLGGSPERNFAVVTRDDIPVDTSVIISPAIKEQMPIVTVSKKGLDNLTKEMIEKINPKKILIVGGPEAVPPAIEKTLLNMGYKTTRIGGEDRYETAALVAEKYWGGAAENVLLVDGEQPALSLVSTPLAHKLGAPILYVKKEGIPETTLKTLRSLKPKRCIIIGATGLEEELLGVCGEVESLSGETPGETSVLVSIETRKPLRPRAVAIFNVENPLTYNAAQFAVLKGGTVLLVDSKGVPEVVAEYLHRNRFSLRWIVFTAGIPQKVKDLVVDLTKPPGAE
ncbi:MAG: hypothetical protein DRO11_06410 [Methanobacteriota archaeon]|nr:MAG: hypothetical protein DRO11_06410 [Euryarchaeota archaeon]